METRTKVISIIVIVSVLAFLLTPMAPLGSKVWPAPELSEPGPTSTQIALLMLYTGLSSIGFGVGIAFLFFGYSYVKQTFNDRFAPFVFFGIFWMLWNWWIHDIGHMTTHGHIGWLLFLEYAFHATSIIFGSIIAYAFVKGRRK